MNKIFFISDLHLHHKNILKYEPIRLDMMREFYKDTTDYAVAMLDKSNDIIYKRMDADSEYLNYILTMHDIMLVNKWNSVVDESDIVYDLGDISLHADTEWVKECLHALKGKHILVLGNHDVKDRRIAGGTNINKVFKEVEKFRALNCFAEVLIKPTEIKLGIWVSHEPIEYINTNYPAYNIYGHVHSNPLYKTETEVSRCVCVERTNGFPIELDILNTNE